MVVALRTIRRSAYNTLARGTGYGIMATTIYFAGGDGQGRRARRECAAGTAFFSNAGDPAGDSEWAMVRGVGRADLGTLRLVLEELLLNICLHAYSQSGATAFSTGREAELYLGLAAPFPELAEPGGQTAGELVLGLRKGLRYSTFSHVLERGGALPLYTDGAPEAVAAPVRGRPARVLRGRASGSIAGAPYG